MWFYDFYEHEDVNNNQDKESVPYTSQDVCPICGAYEPDGNVCAGCQKKYNM